MKFLKRKKSGPARRAGEIIKKDRTSVAENSSGSSQESIEYKDRVARLLRVLGQFAFDVGDLGSEQISKSFEAWARHILIGGQRPDHTHEAMNQRGSGIDWPGLIHFISEHRQSEKLFVDRSLNDFKKVVWAFVHSFGESVNADRDSDITLFSRLDRLKSVVETGSIETIKHESIAAIHSISKVIDARKTRRDNEIRRLSVQLESMRDQLREAEREVEIDPLTQLYNRKSFDDFTIQTIDFNLFSRHDTCMVVADIDEFMTISDNHGNLAGDEILRQLADRCIRTFPRKSDFIARYGSDEFSVIVSDASIEEGKILAKRLLKAVNNQPFKVNQRMIEVTVSVGVTCLYENDTKKTWLDRIDRAVDRAKQMGRNQVAAAVLPAKASHPSRSEIIYDPPAKLAEA